MSTHRIEEHAKVYLTFNSDTNTWDIDPVCLDGSPLDGLNNPDEMDTECECDWEDEHNATLNAAMRTPIPTAEELLQMLAAELGYKLSPID